jgi:hypothetical protein
MPVELLDRILALTNPQTVSAFSQTTRTFRSYVADNAYLWRSLSTKYFDALHSDSPSCVNWAQKVKERTRAYLIAKSTSPSFEDCEIAAEALIDVVGTITPGSTESRTIAWLKSHILLSPIWTNKTDSPILAKLHVLRWDPPWNVAQRVVSRAYVYDMRNYHKSTLWGPFLRHRRGRQLKANYIHMMHLMYVQVYHWAFDSGLATGFESTRAMTAPPSLVEGDWAGVEGVWVFFVSWMDYDELAGTFHLSNHVDR